MSNNSKNMFKKLLLLSSGDIIKFMDVIRWSTNMFTFRGQSDCSWDISSGLERRFPEHTFKNKRNDKLNKYEKNIIRKFQAVSHHHLENPPLRHDDYLEWLSIIQHYGGKTRLVDFSRSILISLYFAIEHEKKECNAAIWAVNRFRLWSYRRYFYSDELENVGEWEEIDGVWVKETVNDYIFRPKNKKEVILVKPFRLNQRLQCQKGEFIIPSSLCNSFMENLATAVAHSYCEIDDFYEDKAPPYCDFSSLDPAIPISEINFNDRYDRYGVIKIEIPLEFHEELRRLLKNFNVTAGMLFPDFEGIIRELDNEGDEI